MRRIRYLDVMAVILGIATISGVSLLAYGDQSEPNQVSVQSDDGEFLYPLSQPLELDVAGPIGHTHIEIDGTRARIVSSPCRDQTCVAAGWLELTGEWTACLPNRVFVRVQGGEREDGVDGQTF